MADDNAAAEWDGLTDDADLAPGYILLTVHGHRLALPQAEVERLVGLGIDALAATLPTPWT